jgi:manganese-dependent ADP-ribose/CDP-alcohol diphosphatase
MDTESNPLFSCGLIADLQYGDAEDGYDFFRVNKRCDSTGQFNWFTLFIDLLPRRYRNTLNILQAAVASWQASALPVTFIMQLGDVLDGLCRKTPIGSKGSLARVQERFQGFKCYDLIGNHEVRCRITFIKLLIHSGTIFLKKK